jgi:hypothetical protein
MLPFCIQIVIFMLTGNYYIQRPTVYRFKTIQAAGTPSALVELLRDQLSRTGFKPAAPTVLDGPP